jgi:hypothetical protein
MTTRTIGTLSVLFCLTFTACGDDGEVFVDDGIVPPGEGETGDDDLDGGVDPGKEPCLEEPFSLDAVTPKVMFVLDKSGSMNSNSWDDDGDSATPDVTRWYSLHGVVESVTSEYEMEMNFGLTLFPSIDAETESGSFESSCKVSEMPEVAVGPGTASAILLAIPAATQTDFGGATPAAAGMLTGVAHLEELGDETPRAVVLITDGAANCASPDDFLGDYDESLEDAVRDAWEGAGIPTYVVGIDITEDGGNVDVNPRVALDAVAQAGGVPNAGEVGFYDANEPAALESALDQITHSLGCQIELSFAPQEFLQLMVEVDGTHIPQVQSCAETTEAGWVQIDPENQPNKIELCNAACSDAEVAGGVASMCQVVP